MYEYVVRAYLSSLLFISVTVPVVARSDTAAFETTAIPSIRAELLTYHKLRPGQIKSSWLSLSTDGISVKEKAGVASIIKNKNLRKVWLINSKKKTVHEVNVDDVSASFSGLDRDILSHSTQSNLLGNSPCREWVGINAGVIIWRGQKVQEWICQDDQKMLVNTQLFSERWKVVVKIEHVDSRVEELHNISSFVSDPSTYLPPDNYRSVGIQEFFTGRLSLKPFE